MFVTKTPHIQHLLSNDNGPFFVLPKTNTSCAGQAKNVTYLLALLHSESFCLDKSKYVTENCGQSVSQSTSVHSRSSNGELW